jgi:O-antigen ligase
MTVFPYFTSFLHGRLDVVKTQLAPAPDRGLVLALGALFFLFPISKSLYVLPLAVAIILSFRQANASAWLIHIRSIPLLWFPLAIYFLVILQAPLSPADANDVLEHLRKYARLLFLVLFVLVFVGHDRRQQAALIGFTAAMVIIVGATWIRIVWSNPLLGSQADGSALFGDHITQNIMVAFFTVIAFQNAYKSKTHWGRLAWWSILALSVLSITHYSIGRTGQVLLLVVWLSYLLCSMRGWKLLTASLLLALLVWASYSSSLHLRSRFDQAIAEARLAETDRLTSIGHRLYNYQTTPRLIADKPIFGHGTGAYHSQICHYIDQAEQCPIFQRHPHNQFLFLAADHGLVGSALYLAYVAGLFVHAGRSNSSKSSRVMLAAFAAMLLVNSLINSPLFSSRESQFFALMAALLIAMNHSPSRAHITKQATHG